jgi:hypothetical protein
MRRKQNRQSSKIIYSLKDIAIKVYNEHNWNKIYICINILNKKDKLVIPYKGNEGIEKFLGNDCVLDLPSGKRENNLICLVEYTPDKNICKISDGIMIYTC